MAETGDSEEALALARGIESAPARGESLARIALGHALAGNVERALEIAGEIDGESLIASALARIAISEAKNSRSTTADSILQRALQLLGSAKPDYLKVKALTEVARAQFEMQDQGAANRSVRDALANAEKLVENSIDRLRAYGEIASVQARLGDLEAALRTVTSLPDPHQDGVLKRVAEAQAAAGDLEGALQTVGRIGGNPCRAYAIQTLARRCGQTRHIQSVLAWVEQENGPLVRACAFLGVAEGVLNSDTGPPFLEAEISLVISPSIGGN